MDQNRIESLKRAINSAESALKQAKQIVTELEGGQKRESTPNSTPNSISEKPGEVGIYDGEKMTTAKGESYVVPGNYASKSLLVVGDTLKMYEENGEKRFKQIEHVKRHKTTGLLVKKDGKFRAITPEGSYKVLAESINHFGGDVGDEVLLHLPAGNLTSPYGAIETIRKKIVTAPIEDEESDQAPAAPVVTPLAKPKVEVRKPKPMAPAKPAPKPAPNRSSASQTSAPRQDRLKEVPKVVVPSETAPEVAAAEVVEPAAVVNPGEEELS